MTASGAPAEWTDMEFSHGSTRDNTKDTILKIESTASGDSTGPMEEFTKENGIKENNTV